MKFRFRVSDEILTSANFVTNRKTENFVTVSKIKISLLPRKYKISSLLEKYKNPLFRTKNDQKHKISYPKINDHAETLQFRILKVKIRTQNIKCRHQK